MVVSTALVFALQAAPVAATVPVCSFVTPRGDFVGFQVRPWADEGDYIGIIATEGSVWPTRTLPGSRRALEESPPGTIWFAFGGSDGLVLQIDESTPGSPRQAAKLLRRNDRQAGLPLAIGFCEQGRPYTIFRAMDPNADPGAIGQDIPAFDPAQWPGTDCAIILSDGRRLRLSYRLDGGQVQLANAELWPEGAVRAGLQRGRPRRGVSLSRFSRRGGPSGTELFYVQRDPARAVKLIRIDAIRGSAGADLTGHAICGYNNIVRSPAPRE